MLYNNLGKYIRKKRELKGLSLNKFAISNDIDSAILSRIENMQQNIKLNILEKIAGGFGLTAGEFLIEYENNNSIK